MEVFIWDTFQHVDELPYHIIKPPTIISSYDVDPVVAQQMSNNIKILLDSNQNQINLITSIIDEMNACSFFVIFQDHARIVFEKSNGPNVFPVRKLCKCQLYSIKELAPENKFIARPGVWVRYRKDFKCIKCHRSID